MIIKNEYIKIKNGKKETILNNYIYDSYLELFSRTQYSTDALDQQQKKFNECYLKLDESLDDIRNADTNDFELMIRFPIVNLITDKKSVNVTYRYLTDEYVYDITGARERLTKISEYINKKITAIGFGEQNISACLDVNNYDIYIRENEGIEIIRKDIITTEGICENYDFPVHLSPVGDINNRILDGSTLYPKYAKLYSVGLSKALGTTGEEYVIGQDIDINIKSSTSFSFNLRKGDDVSIYPQVDMYPANNLYPMPLFVKTEIYPRNDMYPAEDLYPGDSNYKYIYLKYRLYYFESSQPQYLDEYYSIYIENDTKGLFEFIEKIERSDE